MKTVCDQKKLSDAVTSVQRSVSAKSSITALEGILIRTLTDGIELTGYDMDMAMKITIDAKIEERGEIVLNAKLFVDIIRRLPEEPVSITVDDRLTATISCEETRYSILGIPAHEFPELPLIQEETGMEIDGETLSSMIRQTKFAVAVGDTKPVHTGILFEIRPGRLRLVAVDGYRMAIRTEKIKTEESLQFVVPAKTLGEVEKLVDEETEMVRLMIGKRHILFTIGEYTMFSRLLEGEFLEYEASIPKESVTSAVINTRRWNECIERVSLVINDRIKSPIRCSFNQDTAYLSCVTALGEANDQMTISLNGEEMEMGFNNRYLGDALKACDVPEVRVLMKSPVSPLRIMPYEGESFLYLVLPMRFKSV